MGKVIGFVVASSPGPFPWPGDTKSVSVSPSSWTREYYGYLTTEYKVHYRSSFDCVNVDPDVLAGGTGNTNGALFYHVLSSCNGFQCPPYQTNRALSCVVCTK